jgi:hypothetical protein
LPCARALVENRDKAANVERRSERFSDIRGDPIATLLPCCPVGDENTISSERQRTAAGELVRDREWAIGCAAMECSVQLKTERELKV